MAFRCREAHLTFTSGYKHHFAIPCSLDLSYADLNEQAAYWRKVVLRRGCCRCGVLPISIGVSLSYEVSSRVPKVLVLMATYNGCQWLSEQIQSILAQEGVDVFINIADDGSNDGTRELISQDWIGNTRISVLLRVSASGSAGANFRRMYRESDTAGFDYVALADQDDIWLPGKLRAGVAALATSGAQGYSCGVRPFWPDGREKDVLQCSSVRAADFLFEGAGQGCTYVMTSALFQRVNLFCTANLELSERLHYHDWLVYLLARTWEMSWYFDAQPWIRYRQHLGNEIGSRGSFGAITKRLGMIRNGWYRNQVESAIDVAANVTHHDAQLNEFSLLFKQHQNFWRKYKIFIFVVAHGRRRVSDRIVLGFSALAGWI